MARPPPAAPGEAHPAGEWSGTQDADWRARALAAERELARVRQELDAFAGSISHELQGVLQRIEGFAQALAPARQALAEQDRHYLSRIVASSAQGNQLVHELAAFARAGSQPLDHAPVDMHALLERARRSLEAELAGRLVEWTVGDLPPVAGDAGLLHQVLVHLLSNALRFSRAREVTRIHVDAAAAGGGVEFRVRDNGVGFDPAWADRLFQPFRRLHGSELAGNGMGLAHVRRIVERHGGVVRAESAGDEGALFAFWLPVAPGALAAVTEAPPPQAAQPAQAAQPLRVLVVDDDPMVLVALRGMLEVDGHQVHAEPDGHQGLAAFHQALAAGAPFDLVLTDFGMAHLDGGEVARAVKDARPATHVVLLTGWGVGAEATRQAQAHADVVLGKPPRLAQVREVLRSLAA